MYRMSIPQLWLLSVLSGALGFAGGATPAAAQLDVSALSGGGPERSIELRPAYPQPGDTVTATLSDYSTASYGARITWVLDGTPLPVPAGQRQVRFTAGAAGETQALEAVLTRADGTESFLRQTITPVFLDIILEPQTRVPTDYLGRALPSMSSVVNATALLNAGAYNPDQLVFTWRHEEEVLGGGPLRGGDQVAFTTPWGNRSTLSLQVTDRSGQTIAQRAISVPAVQPQLRFYEINSLYGRRAQALSDPFRLSGVSTVVRAEPYFLDTRVFNDPDVIEWELDRRPVNPAGANPYEVTVQRAGESGRAELEFHVRSRQQVLQGSDASLTITY